MIQFGSLEPTKSYATTDNPIPKSQDVALAEEASNNQTGTAEKDKKAEKKAPDKKKDKSTTSASSPSKPKQPLKPATAKTMAEHEAGFADPDNPTKAEMTAWSKATE
jgi:hypothetical protein